MLTAMWRCYENHFPDDVTAAYSKAHVCSTIVCNQVDFGLVTGDQVKQILKLMYPESFKYVYTQTKNEIKCTSIAGDTAGSG